MRKRRKKRAAKVSCLQVDLICLHCHRTVLSDQRNHYCAGLDGLKTRRCCLVERLPVGAEPVGPAACTALQDKDRSLPLTNAKRKACPAEGLTGEQLVEKARKQAA